MYCLFDPCKVNVWYTLLFLLVHSLESSESQDNDQLLSDLNSDYINCDFSLEHSCSSNDNFTNLELSKMDTPPSLIGNLLHDDKNTPFGQDIGKKRSRSGKLWWHQVFTPTPIPKSECENQVQHYLKDLEHFELWAMQLWDATAKPTAGLLSGNANQLGDYDSCLNVHLASLGMIHGKYCLVDIDLKATSDALPSIRTAIVRLQGGSFSHSKHTDPSHFAPRWSTLHWGLCVPAACSDREVEEGLHKYLQDYKLSSVSLDMAIKPGACYTTSQSDLTLPFHTLVTIGFLGGVLMLVVVATMMDNTINNSLRNNLNAGNRAILAFSLRRNWELLVTYKPDELPIINGIRSIFSIMLLFAHKVIPIGLTPYTNRVLITELSHSYLSAILRASSVFTDSFLQLSAVLAAYNISKELQKYGSTSWRQRILGRFIRLTPSLLAVVLFYAYVLEHLGSGPQWPSTITVNADKCKASLWKNILYIQNFYPFEHMCAPHTHQLALDMQLFIMAPIVVYCLHYWHWFSTVGLIVVQLVISYLRYFTHLQNNLSLFIYHNISLNDLYRTANMSYTKPIQRAIPYIVGLMTGFFLQRVKKVCLSHVQVVTGWVLCTVFAAVSIFYQAHLVSPNRVFDVYDSAWYSAFSPITMSMALSWIIIACSSGYGGWFNKWLCLYQFVIFSRLSYSIYLVQFITFFYNVGNLRSSQEFSMFHVFGVYEIASIAFTSLFVTLVFDLPMQEIKSILLPSRKADKVS